MRFDGRVEWQNVFGGMGKRGKFCLKIIEGVGGKKIWLRGRLKINVTKKEEG